MRLAGMVLGATPLRVTPSILERVRELQAIAARNAAETAEKMARELNEIQYEARADKAHDRSSCRSPR